MAERLSRQYKIKKLEIELIGGGGTKDIRDLVADFEYHEAIESPFIRCDFTIVDAVDFNKALQGGEKISVEIETDSSKGQPMKFTNKVWKIGSIIKSERGQMYILHTVSPEMFENELNKVFEAFGPESNKDKPNIPKFICEKYLKAKDSGKIKSENFEDHSKITFISPSWKPVDAIAYLSDKVTRKGSSKGSATQSGYLFFENKRGFQFRSIDGLAEGKASKGEWTYTYIQQGSAPKDNGYYVIESIQYPDKADHLKSMRLGTYKSIAIGISISEPTNNRLTDSGTSGKTAPGGTIYPPKIITFQEVFKKASKIEKLPPYKVPDYIEEASPTRQKIRILPGLKNQQELGKKEGTDADNDTMAVAEYAAARYNLLRTIQLTVVIPGNSALTVGDIIKVKIPASQEEGKKVKEDAKFSGKYLIAAVSHTFKREGLTTKLILIRDSIKEASY